MNYEFNRRTRINHNRFVYSLCFRDDGNLGSFLFSLSIPRPAQTASHRSRRLQRRVAAAGERSLLQGGGFLQRKRGR